MWSIVEVNIGITCACIPTLKPVVSWTANHLPLRNCIWTSRIDLFSTSRQQFETEEPGSTTEWIEDTLVNGRYNRQADNRTEPEGEHLPQSLQSDIDLGTVQTPGIVVFDFVGSSSLESMIDFSTKQSIRPLIIINTLCFIIGFAEGNLWDLTCKFSALSDMTQLEIRVTYALYYWLEILDIQKILSDY